MEVKMRTVSKLEIGKSQVVKLSKDMEFEGINELEIIKEGDSIILRPARPDWLSLAGNDKADADFMAQREDVVGDVSHNPF
jgi:antitoxin VapB